MVQMPSAHVPAIRLVVREAREKASIGGGASWAQQLPTGPGYPSNRSPDRFPLPA